MSISTQPKMWYWIVSIIFLLWNIIGVGALAAEFADPAMITADFTPEQLEIYNNRPWWYLPNFGIAVVTGTLACVMLFFKNKLAVPLALICLIAITISTAYEVFFSGSWETLDMAGKGFALFILLMDVLLILFARMAAKRGWIR